jgi:hypothetical protein
VSDTKASVADHTGKSQASRRAGVKRTSVAGRGGTAKPKPRRTAGGKPLRPADIVTPEEETAAAPDAVTPDSEAEPFIEESDDEQPGRKSTSPKQGSPEQIADDAESADSEPADDDFGDDALAVANGDEAEDTKSRGSKNSKPKHSAEPPEPKADAEEAGSAAPSDAESESGATEPDETAYAPAFPPTDEAEGTAGHEVPGVTRRPVTQNPPRPRRRAGGRPKTIPSVIAVGGPETDAPPAPAPERVPFSAITGTGNVSPVPKPVHKPQGTPRPAAAPRTGGRRKVKLQVTSISPWSIMKIGFLMSVALGVAFVVMAWVVWHILDAANVFSSIDTQIASIVGSDNAGNFSISQYLSQDKVMAGAALIGVFDVVIGTVLSLLGAFVYNITSALVGGVHMTMTDD